jgi:hypothetical protein
MVEYARKNRDMTEVIWPDITRLFKLNVPFDEILDQEHPGKIQIIQSLCFF